MNTQPTTSNKRTHLASADVSLFADTVEPQPKTQKRTQSASASPEISLQERVISAAKSLQEEALSAIASEGIDQDFNDLHTRYKVSILQGNISKSQQHQFLEKFLQKQATKDFSAPDIASLAWDVFEDLINKDKANFFTGEAKTNFITHLENLLDFDKSLNLLPTLKEKEFITIHDMTDKVRENFCTLYETLQQCSYIAWTVDDQEYHAQQVDQDEMLEKIFNTFNWELPDLDDGHDFEQIKGNTAADIFKERARLDVFSSDI